MHSILLRFCTPRSPNSVRTLSTSPPSSARRTRAARVSHPTPSNLAPPLAPLDSRPPRYRPVPHLSLAPTRIKSRGSYSRLFQTRTRWIAQTLARGESIPPKLVYKVLHDRNLDPNQFAEWVQLLHRRDPVHALERLGLLESASRATEISSSSSSKEEEDEEGRRTRRGEKCPDWLYLSIPAMVTNHQHAPYLASQLLSNRFQQLDERSKSFFLSRCIQHFLTVKHYVALRETIEFIAYTSGAQGGGGGGTISKETSYGRILQALSSERERASKISSAPTGLLHSLRDLVLLTMKERQVSRKGSLDTWLPLFSRALIPRDPTQAIELLIEMTEAGWTPRSKVLHQVLNVVVRNGGVEGKAAAAKLRQEIERARAGGGRSRWLKMGLAKGIESVPLHLRAERGQKVDDVKEEEEDDSSAQETEPLDTVRVKEEEEEKDYTTSMTDSLDAPRSLVSETPKLESNCGEAPLPPTRTSSSSVLPSSSPVRAANLSRPSQTRVRRSRSVSAKTNIYSTTQLFDRTTSLSYFAQLREYVSKSGRAASFPPPPFPSDRVAWTALFQSIVHEPSVDSKLLLAVLQKLENASSPGRSQTSTSTHFVPPSPHVRLYAVVMRCLFVRNARREVDALFRRLRSKGFALDATIIDQQVQSLCSLNRAAEAIRLVRFYEHLPSKHDPSSLLSLRTPPSESNSQRPRSIRLDIVPFNSILSHLNQAGEYHRAYSLFKELEAKHEVRPDVATMSIMIDAARYASLEAGRGWSLGMEDLGQVQIGGGGGNGGRGQHSRRGGGGGSQRRTSLSVGPTEDKWDRVPAARKMELLAWDQIIEANWQETLIENPLDGRTGMSRWLSDRFSPSHRASARAFAERIDPPPDWRPFVSTLSPRPSVHPDIYPTDQLIRSLVLLTGVHSHIPLIGQILAWARYANVKLSRYTLCLALLYVEGDAGIKRRKIENLRKWLGDWIGVENVPQEEEIAWMRRGGTVKGKPVLR